MSRIAKGEVTPIEHGTVHGHNQHKYRNVPFEPSCGCLDAYNRNRAEQRREQKQLLEKYAPKSAYEWNGGMTDPGDRPTVRPRSVAASTCTTDGCGRAGTEHTAAPPGWVYARVAGSAEPGRWWCSGQCSTYGIALAELRPAGAAGGAS